MAAVPIPTAAKSGRVYGYKAERVAISVQDAAFMIEKRLATTRFVKQLGESTGESRNRGGDSDCHKYDKLLSRDQHLSLDGRWSMHTLVTASATGTRFFNLHVPHTEKL
jgi:hypothetical protein